MAANLPLRRYRCHGCGGEAVTTSSHAVRFCSPACMQKRQRADAQHRAELMAAGFEAHPAAANVMWKDGYAVSIEECWQAGGTKGAIENHARWMAKRAGTSAA